MKILTAILALCLGGCAGSALAPVGNTLNKEIGLGGHLAQQIFVNAAEVRLSLGPPPNIDITFLNNRPLTIQNGVTTTTSVSTQIAK